MKIDDQGNIHDGSGKFSGHIQGEGDTDQVLPTSPPPGEVHKSRCERLNAKLARLEEERDQAYAELNTYAFAETAAQILAEHPEAHSLELLSWEEETSDGGGYDITNGAILDADGNEIGDAPEGCITSTQLNGSQHWEPAYIGGRGSYWNGRLDLHELVRIGDELAEANRVQDHIEDVCSEAGYGTMVDILHVTLERESLEDEHYLALSADDLEGIWDGYVGPAIDDVERCIRGDYD